MTVTQEVVSGLEHPQFVRIIGELTEQGPRKIKAVAESLSGIGR